MAATTHAVSRACPGFGLSWFRRIWSTTVVVLLGLFVPLGAVTFPQLSMLLGVVLAALAGGFVRMLHSGSGADVPTLPHPAVAAVFAGLLPAALAGTTILGMGPFGIAGGCLVAASAIGLWGASWASPSPVGQESEADRESDDGSLRDLLRTVPVDLLCDEWRAMATPLVPVNADPACRKQLRRLLLSELHRRHPVGTARWLLEAPEALPDHYIQDPRGTAA